MPAPHCTGVVLRIEPALLSPLALDDDPSTESRAQYRVDGSDALGLSAILRIRTAPPICPELRYVSIGGMSVVLGAGQDELVKTGDVARVSFASDDAGRGVVGLSFEDPDELYQRIPQHLEGVFNKRRAVRVRPDPGASVVSLESSVGPEHPTTSATLVDISILGMGMSADASPLRAASRCVIKIDLPTGPAPMKLRAYIRRAWDADGMACLGIEFDESQWKTNHKALEVIRRYVMDRQAEMLRQGRA